MTLVFVPASPDRDTVYVSRLALRSLPRRWSWSYAAAATIEGKEKRQAVAVDAEQLTVGLLFHAQWMPVQRTIDELRGLASAFEVISIQQLPGTIIYGDFVIESIDVQPNFVLEDGTLISASVTLGLAEPGIEELLILSTSPTPSALSLNAIDTTTAAKSDNPTGSPAAVAPKDIARL